MLIDLFPGVLGIDADGSMPVVGYIGIAPEAENKTGGWCRDILDSLAGLHIPNGEPIIHFRGGDQL